MLTQSDRLQTIRAAFPREGLFAEKAWLLSPDAFPVEKKFVAELEQLGHRLFVFQRACNQLYQLSIKGKQPAWIARYLDAGKPKELIEFSRRKEIRDDLPRVIRPDLILTEKGYIIAEIDSVPGGIGLTGWLNQTYSTFDSQIIGGADGMLEGFRTVLPNGGDIVISQEAATYRPEMEWIAARLNQKILDTGSSILDEERVSSENPASGIKHPESAPSWRVVAAENYEPQDGRAVYRFFELFDLPNIPGIENTLRANAESRISITPPIKPYLEEKMWFALFWMQPLREFWRRELGEKYFSKLQEVIPYSWLLDPTPLPQHAVIPRLEIHDWREAAKFSQKDRDLLLKVSGFSPLGWGSRGITLGADLPHAEWEKRINHALETFDSSPTIMQRFQKGSLFDHQYWDPDSNELKTMKGRVRLCPYFFVEPNRVTLRGALATIAPADKKFVHGMSDAILVPSKMQ
ncbi:MAG: hypothetical protein AUF68_06180 [Verrucomicrobia bacterium 13_1_20CM_54_28]|jgi:hypothetical protein|nr:MAG: hypothetical protein AUI00_02815 [Verrucomicrobia bacterium 13_2_20CM_2_54_15]OLD72657.1 MAG: hypothetical protein AUF68_06180 [Verrucomicrobia bacterium 13_1_20CM_54_28]OLD88941.1 MAG: hypothetical protein AUG81_05300 [Verrucomicrobia bacterium 13_1_20CM_4_54_11]OLE11019.1 MAG: hypothetical protein AUG52_08090 [Verrucomicrobia bacterium 13_1_20CM_3_54_17]PYK12567.1 MAG: hypothetical protein DME64_16250 [Verrucomicrobiota bacterium]